MPKIPKIPKKVPKSPKNPEKWPKTSKTRKTGPGPAKSGFYPPHPGRPRPSWPRPARPRGFLAIRQANSLSADSPASRLGVFHLRFFVGAEIDLFGADGRSLIFWTPLKLGVFYPPQKIKECPSAPKMAISAPTKNRKWKGLLDLFWGF